MQDKKTKKQTINKTLQEDISELATYAIQEPSYSIKSFTSKNKKEKRKFKKHLFAEKN